MSQERGNNSTDSSISRIENSDNTISRRHSLVLLLIGGLGVSMGLSNCRCQNDKETKPQATEVSETPNKVNKTPERQEIMLGNARFYLEQPNSLPTEKRTELFENMEKAYNKLKDYFGSGVVMLPNNANVPIVIGQVKIESGMVTWNASGVTNSRGELDIDNKPDPKRLLLSNFSESNIAHEFVHLFVQAPILWSQAFYEGNAYAIQNTLYPPDSNLESIDDIASNPGISSFLDFGLDFHSYDMELKGGIQSDVLYRLAISKWEHEWKEFLKKDPNFFKNFYSEIAKQKKGGKVAFSKNELEAIGGSVSAGFNEWYKGTRCLKTIGEDEEAVKQSTILIKSKNILFSCYFQTHARKIDGASLMPPFLSPLVMGKLQISSNAGGQELILYPNNWDNFCALTKLPEQVANDPNLKVAIVK